MFVWKKRNKTGTISVVVVDKRHGFKEVRNFGVVSTDEEADVLCMRAREWIHSYGGQQVLDFGRNTIQDRELEETKRAFANIDSVFMNAPQLILNPIYDSIGFNRIPDEVLRHLVIARICQPMSKLATVDYLKSHFNEDTSLDRIYHKHRHRSKRSRFPISWALGRGTGVSCHKGKSGGKASLSLYLKTDRGTYLYMLHCIQGVQRTGKDYETDEVSDER